MTSEDFRRIGFDWNGEESQWYNGEYVIYAGLGVDKDGKVDKVLYTYCRVDDIGDSNKIIFRGESHEMVNFFKKINRNGKLNDLGI